MTNEKHFPKTISQWEFDYGLFTNLPRIIIPHDFSPSSFKLKRGILPLLPKYVSWLENYLSYQAKKFFVNYAPTELTPCKISHICHCTFNTTYQNSKKHVFKSKLWNTLFAHAHLKWILPSYNVNGSGRYNA